MDIKKAISKAPDAPGIYFFTDRKKRILYIGKAANIRARLRSYLRPGWKEKMLTEASGIRWEELSSDVESLIREAELIKTHHPKYNVLFRDDKNYFSVGITKDACPRIFLTHQPREKASAQRAGMESAFIGPFTDGASIKRVLGLLRKAFPYCTCSPRAPHARACINAELGKCPGFCCRKGAALKTEIDAYNRNIGAIKKILSGKARMLLALLEKNMLAHAQRHEYEKARTLRDQMTSLDQILKHSPHLKREIEEERLKALDALKHLLKLEKIPERIEGYDISHHQGDTSVASMVVFERGLPKKSDYRKFIIKSVAGINDPAMMQEVITRRLEHSEWPRPDFILIDGGKGQRGAVRDMLNKNRVRFGALAKRGEKLYIEDRKEPLPLKTLQAPLSHLLAQIRDEAHRFAVAFHRLRRSRLVMPR